MVTCARCGGEVPAGAPRCACGYPASPAGASAPPAPPPLPAPRPSLAAALGFDAAPAPAAAPAAEASFEDLDLGGDPEPGDPVTPATGERARYRGPAAGPSFTRVVPRRSAATVLAGIAALCLAAVGALVYQARRLERAQPAPAAAEAQAAPAPAAAPARPAIARDSALEVAAAPAAAIPARTLQPAAPSAPPPARRARAERPAPEQAPEHAQRAAAERRPPPAAPQGAGSVGPATVVSLDRPGPDADDVPLPPPPAGATPVEDAPRYAAQGFRRPRLLAPRCVQEAIRLPRGARERVSGPVTVRFAVAKDGTVGLFEVLGDLPDRRVADAIWTAVRGCGFAPGADAAGKPTRLWVVMPIRFDE